MGVLQALQAIKVLTGNAGQEEGGHRMLLFSSMAEPAFRSVRLRATRRAGCAACSDSASVSAESLTEGSMDYVQFCGGGPSGPEALPEDLRVSAKTLADASQFEDVAVLDVRDETQFGLCSLGGSVNIPWTRIASSRDHVEVQEQLRNVMEGKKRAFVVCRLGNDSQDAVRKFQEWGFDKTGCDLKDVVGGLKAWREEVDASFPEY
jgi:adenylyltransferase and sulfurtransferase